MGESALVRYESRDLVGRIVLDRPDKRNALNVRVWNDLEKAVILAEEDREARVILVTGEGPAFSAGLDLSPDNELFSSLQKKSGAAGKVEFFREVMRIQEIHNRLERLTRPTIAVVQGYCLGAGLELVLCCDLRLAETNTQFALPEARLAIITDLGGLQRLPAVVGPAKAREIAYRGHRFGAREALNIGLVNNVYESPEELKNAAEEMALEIAANPPLAVQGAKEVFLFAETVDRSRSINYNAARSAMVLPSEDLLEAVAAHMQKRSGRFKGN